ncbi:TIGR02099 family protein [Pseudoduganella umbonata]|uniref:TIGR02099 family protein n=1 Tax=Pseudoduganella umbonata TaxID=864828 RepID=A0ABX5UT02_9BURK|nr:TIGR02099 family protein [Pseudoduganella umbonata]
MVVRWHRLQAAYRLCNLATHHVLGFTIKLVLVVYFALALLFLALRWAVLPNIDHYKDDIERLASRAAGNPVTIDRIYASWSGLRPNLFLGDVVLRDGTGRQALRLPSVSATLSWWSLATFGVRFESIELIRPNLDVRREADGKLYVAGVLLDPERKDDGSGADWLLAQREIVIREGRVAWTDAMRGTEPLALQDLHVVLHNSWGRHRFGIKAAPPRALGGTLDIRADFRQPAFTQHAADVRQWRGTLYAAVRNADLAAWKPHLPYPHELASGRGSLRAWFDIDRARLTGATADVALDDVVATLGPDLPRLDVAALAGRLAFSEDKAPRGADREAAFGAYGHRASVTGLTLRTRDGAALAPTTVTERTTPATRSRPASTELTSPALDLQVLAGLATRLPLPAAQRTLLADLAPRGRVENLQAQWQGPLSAPAAWRVRADLRELGMAALSARAAVPADGKSPALPAMPALPGFERLSGTVEAREDGGSIVLDAPGFAIDMPAWFDTPRMPFRKLLLDASWSRGDEGLRVDLGQLEFDQEGLTGALSGSHVLPAGKDGRLAGPGTADIRGKLDGFTINRIGRYLPVATPAHLKTWLTGALEGGSAHDVSVRLAGDLAHFPFAADTPDFGKGEFRIAGRIKDGKLNYEPSHFAPDGKSPLWPQAEQIQGSFVFERARMEIRGDTAKTGNVNLANVKAVIADLIHHDSVLEIDGNAAGAMSDYLRYVANSPVLGWIGHFTDQTSATGNAKLTLRLDLPLNRLLESKVNGTLQLQGNDVTLWNDMPPVLLATGKIEFNERGVNLNGLNGTLLGGQLTVGGGTQRDGTIAVRIGGNVTADGLRRTYPSPALQRLARHIDGGTRYNGLITAHNHRYQVVVESLLTGVALDFPAPLVKNAADALPVHFVLNGAATDEAGLARDDIRISLGSTVAAYYQRQRQSRGQERGAWQLVRGGIGVNTAAPEPDSGMALNVSMKSLNVDDWLALGTDIAGAGGGNGGGNNGGGNNAGGNTGGNSGSGGGIDLAQYIVPETMAARTDELILASRKLDGVVLGATHRGGAWQANIDSRQANGYITWAESPTGRGLGKVTARLSSLIIPESAAGDVKDMLERSASSPAIPALDIVAERFELFNRPLGSLELQAYNALITSSREWRVSKLALVNADGALHGTGRWVTRGGRQDKAGNEQQAGQQDERHNTALNFNLEIHDAGKLLERFGFADTVKGGKGKLSGDIAWKGLPYSLDIPTLSGKLDLNVEKGQFLKQDPGAAKLLGVLSLQALPRLLKFDFNDVFSQGLQFDGLTAGAQIDRGIVKTENLKMHGVQATVLMAGTADIANESTNLHVVVIPELNFGTAPLVYALAVNPVIGLGSYLAQLFLAQPMMKALTYQMQVTGPWKAPVITKLDENRLNPGRTVTEDIAAPDLSTTTRTQ